MADQPENIRHDLLDSLEILNLKKVAISTWAFIKDPMMVVDSITEGNTDFVKPIKYIITIGTPILIALNIVGTDTGSWLVSYSINESQTNPDPGLREKSEILAQFGKIFLNKVAELSPFIYLFTMPILAIITKAFYKPIKKPFYYFFSFAYYVGGILCLWNLTTLFIFSLFEYHRYIDVSVDVVSILIVVYFNLRLIAGSAIIRAVKSASISLFFYGITWLLFTMTLILSLYFSKFGSNFNFKTFNYNYRSHYIMGEASVPLNEKSDSLVSKYDLKVKRGFFVLDTYPNSPADRAGLKEGDVIIKVKGILTQDFRDMRIALDSIKFGDTLAVLVDRNGNQVQMQIPVIPTDSLIKKPRVLMGFRRDFRPNSVNKYGFKNGSIITEIVKNSPAEQAGADL